MFRLFIVYLQSMLIVIVVVSGVLCKLFKERIGFSKIVGMAIIKVLKLPLTRKNPCFDEFGKLICYP